MNTNYVTQIAKKSSAVFVGLLVGLSSLFINVNGFVLKAATEAPALPVANEVVYSNATTAAVTNAEGFITAYRNPEISRIVLFKDIDVSKVSGRIAAVQLTRSLQIDGRGHTFKSANSGLDRNDYTGFYLADLKGETATFHLKNVNVWARGLNFFDGHGLRSRGWQVILDNATFEKNGTHQVQRVARLNYGHIFLRGNVRMISNGENFYVGQITVEPNAKVYGETNFYDSATWWFPDANVDGSINIGENARVELVGFGGTIYPVIYQHWREINVNKNATLKGSKKGGHIYTYADTAGVTDKYINVFEGATIMGTSGGGSPVIRTEFWNSVKSHFYAAPASHVSFVGATANDAMGIIEFNNDGSDFVIDRLSRYDIRNNRPTGKIAAMGPNTQFVIKDVDMAVWKKGANKDVTDAPDYRWDRTSVVADSSGQPLESNNADLLSTWNTNDYARITGGRYY